MMKAPLISSPMALPYSHARFNTLRVSTSRMAGILMLILARGFMRRLHNAPASTLAANDADTAAYSLLYRDGRW